MCDWMWALQDAHIQNKENKQTIGFKGLGCEITIKPGAKQHGGILITTMNCMYMSWTKEDENILKHNRTRDQIAQANIHTQRHVNNDWSEMITSTSCLALYCTFPPWFKQSIWNISTPTSHKPYGFIQTLFILIPLTITILWLWAT